MKKNFLEYDSVRQAHEDIKRVYSASDELLCAALKLLNIAEDLDDINKSLEQPMKLNTLNLYRYAKFAYEYAEMARNVLSEAEEP